MQSPGFTLSRGTIDAMWLHPETKAAGTSVNGWPLAQYVFLRAVERYSGASVFNSGVDVAIPADRNFAELRDDLITLLTSDPVCMPLWDGLNHVTAGVTAEEVADIIRDVTQYDPVLWRHTETNTFRRESFLHVDADFMCEFAYECGLDEPLERGDER